jgi:hypothetical protein
MPKDRQLPKADGSRKIAVAAAGKAQPKRPKPRAGGASALDKRGEPGGLIAKLRKPMAPPMRVVEDERKYSRARMRQRSHHEDEA